MVKKIKAVTDRQLILRKNIIRNGTLKFKNFFLIVKKLKTKNLLVQRNFILDKFLCRVLKTQKLSWHALKRGNGKRIQKFAQNEKSLLRSHLFKCAIYVHYKKIS
jgi:hypothetical protein